MLLLLATLLFALPNPTKNKHYKAGHEVKIEKQIDRVPNTISTAVGTTLGDVYVYYNDRVCQMQIFAVELCQRVYGQERYRGLSSEQVLGGFIYNYDEWCHEPFIRLAPAMSSWVLDAGIEYAGLANFFTENDYKIGIPLQRGEVAAQRQDEIVQLLKGATTGELLKIWPPRNHNEEWLSFYDTRNPSLSPADQLFRTALLDSINAAFATGRNTRMNELLTQLHEYQQSIIYDKHLLPTETQTRIEYYLRITPFEVPIALVLILSALIFGIWFEILIHKHRRVSRIAVGTEMLIALLVCIGIITVLIAYGIVYESIPLTNLYEWLIALSALVLIGCLIYVRIYSYKNKRGVIAAVAMFIAGLLLLVSALL